MSRTTTEATRLTRRAQAVLAGGVSSDARRLPNGLLFADHAQGAYLIDADGNRYLDYVLGQGPAVLGHSHPAIADAVATQVRRGISYSAQHVAEIEVAETLCRLIPGAERVRFNSVGSEAVHAALRLARGRTGRTKVCKFEGHYHGWFDPVLYSVHPAVADAGPREKPHAVPGSAGQQLSSAGDLVVAPWNDLPAFEAVLDAYGDDLAAVILEPILCNTGAIMPAPGYLERVQELCRAAGVLLVFDEIITGFRMAPGGAQEYLGITPDLSTFGKAMAGGMQLSALVGRAEVMEDIATGRVAHAGTFNSHPVAVAAARASLAILDEQRDEVYPKLFALGRRLADGLREAARSAGVPVLVDGPGPVVQTYLTSEEAVRDYRDFARTDRAAMARLHGLLMDRGVNVVPRGLWFLSAAHTEQDVDETVAIFAEAIQAL